MTLADLLVRVVMCVVGAFLTLAAAEWLYLGVRGRRPDHVTKARDQRDDDLPF